MKKALIAFLALFALIVLSGTAGADLSVIGTATYGGNPYNLIFEGELGSSGLVWLDYRGGNNNWWNQVNWASGLNNEGVLTYSFNPDIAVSWGGAWRLPETVDGPKEDWGWNGTTIAGYNITSSELGHLYYVSLGNLGWFDTNGYHQPGFGLKNVGPFNSLLPVTTYWSGTEYSLNPNDAWLFTFYHGSQDPDGKAHNYHALAVRPGEVSAVPVPASVLLFASGLLGLVGLGRKFRK